MGPPSAAPLHGQRCIWPSVSAARGPRWAVQWPALSRSTTRLEVHRPSISVRGPLKTNQPVTLTVPRSCPPSRTLPRAAHGARSYTPMGPACAFGARTEPHLARPRAPHGMVGGTGNHGPPAQPARAREAPPVPLSSLSPSGWKRSHPPPWPQSLPPPLPHEPARLDRRSARQPHPAAMAASQPRQPAGTPPPRLLARPGALRETEGHPTTPPPLPTYSPRSTKPPARRRPPGPATAPPAAVGLTLRQSDLLGVSADPLARAEEVGGPRPAGA